MSWFEFVTCDLLKIENNEIKYEDGNIVKLLFFLCYYEFPCFFMNWNVAQMRNENLRFVIC